MALVKVDLDRRLGTIDRKLYGMFIEHLGRCIYGGIYEPGSPLADADGFRTKEVIVAGDQIASSAFDGARQQLVVIGVMR